MDIGSSFRRGIVGSEPGTEISRRRFIGFSAAGVFGSSLFGMLGGLGRVSAAGVSSKGSKERILVIGAGMSGLAAARTLTDAGHDVLVLEARQRTGGRIHSSRHWADGVVDLGASWIHGARRNPLTRLAKQAGARTVETDFESALSFGVDGAPLTAQQQRRMNKLRKRMIRAVGRGQWADVDRSLRATVTHTLELDRLSAEDRRFVEHTLSGVEMEFAGSVSELSTHWFDAGKEFPGAQLVFPNGYGALTAHLAQGLAIELGQVVNRVEVDGVRVKVMAGQSTFEGDRAVVTLPLGVLQAGTVAFSPGLPTAMARAVDALGMGVLNKMYLRFSKVFWPTDHQWIEQIPEQYGRWASWLNMHAIVGKPILMAFTGGEVGRELEKMSDEQQVAAGMDRLRSIFGSSIPDPVDVQISRWASDPFSRGSYSFMKVGCHPRWRDDLAGNIEDRVFFAGEATHRDYSATVHGAYLSGLAAAEKVQAFGGYNPSACSAWRRSQNGPSNRRSKR